MIADDTVQSYFDSIEKEVKRAYELAGAARAKGFDPEPEVNIPIARDLAARVEGLVGTMCPELIGSGLADSIRKLEQEYGKNDERVAIIAGRDVAKGENIKFDTKIKAIEIGLRVAIAYLTLGVVTAPLEGLSDVRMKKNDDGTEYLAIYFAGPIRSAGGTASAMAVLAADFIRIHSNIAPYKPRENELKRYSTEVEDYYSRVTAKQYHPTKEEIEFIIKNVPVEINGDPTEKLEVSNFKDLERVETNQIRGGMCLVLLDGLPLKAEKMLKRIRKYPKEYKLQHWIWLEKFIAMKKKIHAAKDIKSETSTKYTPNAKYVDKIIAGRPVISYPALPGGFRLRYGRSRTGGLATTSIHPLTMHLIPFLAVGTQIATELPGKATVCTPCDTIEGPVVLMKNGDVIEIESKEQIKKLNNDIKEILSVGDLLIPFGEFVSNDHMLLPSSYVEEWWAQEVDEALKKQGKKDERLSKYTTKPYPAPALELALKISNDLRVPLHPCYNFFWHDIEKEDLKKLIEWFSTRKEAPGKNTIVLDKNGPKRILEILCAPHVVEEKEGSIIIKGKSLSLDTCLGKPEKNNIATILKTVDDAKTTMDAIQELSGIIIREKGITRVGMKMGRPEKAEKRILKGRPQILFPCGDAGGRMRNLMESYKIGELESSVSIYRCDTCKTETYFSYCHKCGSHATKAKACRICNRIVDAPTHCNMPTAGYKKVKLNLKTMMDNAQKNIDMLVMPELFKSVKGVFGASKNIEPLEKGLLRAKYDLYVNKDGTTRSDSTDVSLTHFKPREISVPVKTLRSWGYTKDIDGKELENEEQIMALFPQDIIVSDNIEFSTADYLIKISRFIDELLVKFYKLEPFYNIRSKEDLIGHLVIGLAPHTSAGIIGRIIGYTPARVCFAHPFWHAGKRRNCDGDEDSVMLLMDALLNFSRQFMPDTRGGRTMDAPLVLTTCLDPEEVDDESWNVDVDDTYPLGFYRSTLDYPALWDLKSKPRIIEELIGKEEIFHIRFTHDTYDISEGPHRSRYTQLDTMIEKLYGQLELCKKIRAVDANKVAEAVLAKHFLRDIKGNLRKFSKQGFRCANCNEKFRRIPLIGRCTACDGKIMLTISEGSARKYIEPSKRIMDDFRITSYLRQQFLLLEKEADSIFGKKARQLNLSKFQ
ncbi:MAG: DNA polymerase II large subunit [archaeon]